MGAAAEGVIDVRELVLDASLLVKAGFLSGDRPVSTIASFSR